MKNNIFSATSWVRRDREARFAGPETQFDNNCYWTTDISAYGPQLVTRDGVSSYYSINDFYMGTGQEEHGIDSDPQLVNPSARNYQIRDTSPCRDAGTLIPNVNDYVTDGQPDIGYFEYGVESADPVAASGRVVSLAYPQPAFARVSIPFRTELGDHPRGLLTITSADGRVVRRIPYAAIGVGQETRNGAIAWDGKDDRGVPVPSGIYIGTLQAGAETIRHAMVITR